jgi:hypothetical protein
MGHPDSIELPNQLGGPQGEGASDDIPCVLQEHFHSFCRVEFEVSHPFHKEREMDGARSFLTPSVKTQSTIFVATNILSAAS